MKVFLITLLILALIILFGTWPLSIFAKVFEWIGVALKWLAETLDIFGWNGII